MQLFSRSFSSRSAASIFCRNKAFGKHRGGTHGKNFQTFFGVFCSFCYFCDSSNIIEISGIQLFFSTILVILKNSDILFARDLSVKFKLLKLSTKIRFSCDWTSEWYLCIRTPNSLRWSDQLFVIMLSYTGLLRWSERVVNIRSPRASPAFKCECETSSTLSSYICFSPRRFKSGVNL